MPQTLLALVFCVASCGDKSEPGVVETATTATPDETGGTGTAGGDTAGTTSAGTTTSDGGDTAGATTTGATTAGATTGTTTSTPQPPASGLCGTQSASITYAANASRVLNAACTSCHSPSGSQAGIPLNTQATAVSNFKKFNGKGQVDTGRMPTNATLTANQICIIDAWVNQGYN